MADFIVDPDGNVKDCRAQAPPQAPPVIPPSTFHPLFGYPMDLDGSPQTMLEKAMGFLGLVAFGGVLWLILGGVCWMITGEWPSGKGGGYHPIFNRSIAPVPKPPPFIPPVPKPPGQALPEPPSLPDELAKMRALIDASRDRRVGLPKPPASGSSP